MWPQHLGNLTGQCHQWESSPQTTLQKTPQTCPVVSRASHGSATHVRCVPRGPDARGRTRKRSKPRARLQLQKRLEEKAAAIVAGMGF